MTTGYEQALHQLNQIKLARPGAITLGAVQSKESFCLIDLSVDCRGFPHDPGGIVLRQREWFRVLALDRFPWHHPETWVRHNRWAGTPHVQNKNYLCLYAAPGVEWNPSDGMYGYVERLIDWLTMASLDQLDPVGAPLHRPVAYTTTSAPMVVTRANAPAFDGPWWIGLAELTPFGERRLDLVRWYELGADVNTDVTYAVALLLDTPMPFEFPKKLGDLIRELTLAGVSENLLYLLLGYAAVLPTAQDNAYVVIGSPNRGIRGSELKQHLTIWQVDREMAKGLDLTVPRSYDSIKMSEARTGLSELLSRWASQATAEYCPVREGRSEVTRDRSEGSPLQWFLGKKVALWGCGAIGSHVAEILVRSGISEIVLRDNGAVDPGVLVRQTYDDSDIGSDKTTALSQRLRRINPSLKVTCTQGDVLLAPELDSDWTDASDVVVDATANLSVLKRLESLRRFPARLVPALSMVIGHDARASMLCYSAEDSRAGPADVTRKAKIAACERSELAGFRDEFWPDPPRALSFQPEPGCSEPTFTGSDAEVATLVSGMLLAGAEELQAATVQPTVAFSKLPNLVRGTPGAFERVSFSADLETPDLMPDGYAIRISAAAQSDLRRLVQTARRKDREAETGGVLFGEIDEAVRVVWVTDVLGPPPDSLGTKDGFVCGTRGVDRKAAELNRRRRGASIPVGMWHTHPEGLPIPSPTDQMGMRQLVTDDKRPLPHQLLLILGGAGTEMGAYVFHRDKPVVIVVLPPDGLDESQSTSRPRRGRDRRARGSRH